MKINKDLAYGADALQRLDIYVPESDAIADIVLVHGGGWWQGDKRKEDELASALVAANFRVAAINYRLANGAVRRARISFLPNGLMRLQR